MKNYLPLSVVLIAVIGVASTLLPPRAKSDFDVGSFGRLPVLLNGRLKPFDTVARTSLLMLQGRQRVATPEGRALQPIEWLLDVFYAPAAADTYRLTEARYRNGIESFLGLLDAQRSNYAAQRTLVITRLNAATNLVDLYETLGGDSFTAVPAA